MNLIDTLDMYALLHDSNDMTLLLTDYPLYERVSRDVLNTAIIKELGAMRPITTDCDTFKFMLDNFFNKYNYNITRLVDTMYLEYNPLHNKDTQRTLNDKEHRHSIGDIDNTDKYDTGTDETVEGQVSAYDATTYQPKDKSMGDKDVHHEGETTSDIESTVDTDKHTGERLSGKDGQDSYQKLIEQERKVAEFNIFNWIIQQMRKELFLLVY